MKLAREKKKIRVRKKVLGTAERPRLSVFRSLNHVYAQLINDSENKTLISASTLTKDLSADIKKAEGKLSKSKLVGKYLAEQASKQGIETVVFDRNGFRYHGRIQAIAEGAREGGLKF